MFLSNLAFILNVKQCRTCTLYITFLDLVHSCEFSISCYGIVLQVVFEGIFTASFQFQDMPVEKMSGYQVCIGSVCALFWAVQTHLFFRHLLLLLAAFFFFKVTPMQIQILSPCFSPATAWDVLHFSPLSPVTSVVRISFLLRLTWKNFEVAYGHFSLANSLECLPLYPSTKGASKSVCLGIATTKQHIHFPSTHFPKLNVSECPWLSTICL